MITYDELCEIAKPIFKDCGLNINKVNVGVWAKLNGYERRRKLIDGKIIYLYTQL